MRLRPAVLAGVIIAVVCAGMSRTPAPAPIVEAHPALEVASFGGLPVGLRWPDGDATRPVVQAIAADIDADGDLDVVANEGSLDLAVWVNDGTGRLTRATAPPASRSDLCAASPALADPVHNAPIPAPTTTTMFAATLGAATEIPLSGSGATTGPPARHIASQPVTLCSPRAPPAASLI